jgi:HEPN domain-containing protein
MAVELSSKAVLVAFGIDFPKEHDVSFMFKQLSRKRLPKWFLSTLEELAENISELAKLRGLAAYGYEEGLDAEYFKQYAPQAYKKAEKHHNFCVKLLKEAFNIKM